MIGRKIRWIALNQDLYPINAPEGFSARSYQEAEALARAHVAETYPDIPARQFREVHPADTGPFRQVWASRFGDVPRWHAFPREKETT